MSPLLHGHCHLHTRNDESARSIAPLNCVDDVQHAYTAAVALIHDGLRINGTCKRNAYRSRAFPLSHSHNGRPLRDVERVDLFAVLTLKQTEDVHVGASLRTVRIGVGADVPALCGGGYREYGSTTPFGRVVRSRIESISANPRTFVSGK